jgi:hypothetical protein
MIILAQNTITPIVDLIVPSGATAADYILREIINGTARFGIRKDGVVQLSKISNELGHTPTTGSVHANFGSGATVVLQAGSSDMAGSIIITAGTTAGTNPTFVLTFGAAYHGLPRAAFVMPYIDSGSPYYGAGEFWFVASVTAGAITIGFQGTPTDSIAYRIAYFVVGGVA